MRLGVVEGSPDGAVTRLTAHVRTPVYREGYALALSAGLASALGLVYWIIAARAYEPSVVGLNAAAISAMLFLSGLAQLNLVTALTRFIPDAGLSTWRLVGWSYATSLAVSGVVTAVFLTGIDLWAPRLGFLRSSGGFFLWFVVATMIWSIFTLQDSVLTGLRRAMWVPLDNTIFALTKIALLAVFATTFTRYGILASWTFGVVLSVLVINAALAFKLIPPHVGSPRPGRQAATTREIGRFAAADYVGGLFWLASSTLIPIAITQRLGGSANAFFTLAWVMTMPLYLASANIGNSLVVSAVTDRERLREYSQRVFVQTARIVTPVAVAVALTAPYILRPFGEQYSDHATPVLRLLALSAIPNMVTVLYLSTWRAQQRLSLLVWVRGVQCTCAIAAGLALLGPYGIRGPAIAWLAVQTLIATALFLRWPGTLTAGVHPPRYLQRLFVVRNAAADIGLFSVAQHWKRRPDRRRSRAQAEATVPRILGELGDVLPAGTSTWRLQNVIRTVTDKTVGFVGPAEGSPRAVVKLARSTGAARALGHEAFMLNCLAADTRLDGWRSRVPELLGVGEVDGDAYLVESVVPGVDAKQLLATGVPVPEVLEAAATTIAEFHRRTGAELVIGDAILREWVDEPIDVLERHAARDEGEAWLTGALGRLRTELHEALIGNRVSVSFIHGDYVPGNVILDPVGRTVNGIVDWELAWAPNLPMLDIVQLMLSTRMATRHRELGEIVIAALDGAWPAFERGLLERTRSALSGGNVGDRELILLAWVRHTASMLTKAPGYGGNWLWTKSNLEAPLVRLA
jgi:O-antigen/teichoic acid export membrane protein/aminoglycoside phosphotransferase